MMYNMTALFKHNKLIKLLIRKRENERETKTS